MARMNVTCPGCGHTLDGDFPPGYAPPADGDWFVCFTCRAVAVFTVVDGTVSVRAATEAEATQAASDPGVASVNDTLDRHG